LKKLLKQLEKNDRDYKETLKTCNFRKPRRKAPTSEQVGLISISNFEEKK